jgi:putative membrane protein
MLATGSIRRRSGGRGYNGGRQSRMSKLLLRWLILAVSMLLASFLTRTLGLGFYADVRSVADFLLLLLGVAVLALLNATLGRLLKLLTVPLNCLTLGLASLVINAAMLQLAGQLGWGFRVETFWAALIGSAVLSLVNALLGAVLLPEDKSRRDD